MENTAICLEGSLHKCTHMHSGNNHEVNFTVLGGGVGIRREEAVDVEMWSMPGSSVMAAVHRGRAWVEERSRAESGFPCASSQNVCHPFAG